MKKHRHKKINPILAMAAAVLAAAIALPLLYLALRSWELKQSEELVAQLLEERAEEQAVMDGRPRIYHDGQWYILREGLETTLLMGLDKFEENLSDNNSYRNNQQADFLLLLIADSKNEKMDVLQINRDTMTKITKLGLGGERVGSFTGQLALAHTYGTGDVDSCYNTIEAVSNFLYGTKIDHFASVTMDVVPLVNDAMGGVTVTVLDDFSAVDSSLKQGETVTLKGQQALTYVRTRKDLSDSSNIHRMERQRQYMSALYEQFHAKMHTEDAAWMETMMELSTYMVTDYTLDQISNWLEQTEQYELGEFHSIAGEAVKGEEFMEFYADDALLQKQLIELLYEPME